MWGCASVYPSIASFQDAQYLYLNTKPLRGTADFRPLDRRSSRANAQIIKDGEDYVIRLYRTDIVRYRPDGTILLKHGGWESLQTATAMSAMSPFSAWRSKNNLIVRCSSGRFLVPSCGLEFGADLVPKNPPPAFLRKQRVRKDVAKKVRAHFKQIPVMIRAYSAAFKGGDASEIRTRPVMQADLDTPLSEERASEIAMGWLARDVDWGTGSRRCVYSGADTSPAVWKHIYQIFGVVETYEIELPYGEVP